MASKLNPVPESVSFPKIEEQVLDAWTRERTFEQSLKETAERDPFVFYDGPPFATGLPHYGHLLAGTIKDIVPRYWTMKGRFVERRFGWDCHGLPIEALAQEALGLAGSAAIREAGVDVFNEKCRSMVLTYVSEWRKTVTRMGRWVDFDNDYKTMDTPFMESVWWVFKQLWEKKRIYRAHRIMPYSWKLTTPLSNFEANRNYKDVQDPAITVRFKILEGGRGRGGEGAKNMYALAWTTTPWTLPGNLALCAGPKIDYVAVRDAQSGDTTYLLAEARLATYYKKQDQYEIVRRYKGEELKDWTYEPLLPFFPNHPRAFRILIDEFVTTGDGTGIVHLAPAYGEDDYRVCRREEIELVDPLDADCKFTSAIPELAGQFCKDADKPIIKRLKDEGKLVHQSTIQHSYPFCERTDTPLIYRAIDAWYVKVEDLRERLITNNNQVHWVPEAVGEKRFGNWLGEAKDWNISRNRFWGSCLPVWVNEQDRDDTICVESIAELEKLSGAKISDLHKHTLDKIIIRKDGKTYRRTPEVLDCWFESGAMPYAQVHWMGGSDGKQPPPVFPADFIAEGLDQTRGWFYTLMVLSTSIFDTPAFKNVVVNGLVLAEDGKKMSKRLKNYPDPLDVIHAHGADGLRLYMIDSAVVRGDELRFREEGVKDIVRRVILPWWNAYKFFATYARVDGWTPGKPIGASPNLLDRWVRSRLQSLIADVRNEMDQYHLYAVVPRLLEFIDELTNLYIRLNRRRYWAAGMDEDKRHAYQTLFDVLLDVSKLMAPFTPFIADKIYRELSVLLDTPKSSVHLEPYPDANSKLIDAGLEDGVARMKEIIELGRVIREKHGVAVRYPLRELTILHRDDKVLAHIKPVEEYLRHELNVKAVHYSTDESSCVSLIAKPNQKLLGPRLGKDLGAVRKAFESLSVDVIAGLEDGRPALIAGHTITPEETLVERHIREGAAAASNRMISIQLDCVLTDELKLEGMAREVVNRIQKMRKDAGYEVENRIRYFCATPDARLASAITQHATYIGSEVLGQPVDSTALDTPDLIQDHTIDGIPIKIGIKVR